MPFSAAAGYGLTTGAYIGARDLVHINAHGDLLFANGRVGAGGTLGIGGGSYVAVTATGVLAVMTTALLIAVAHSNLD